jgi:glycosyltransferase involved in cell wall biosynthesis
MMTGQWWQWVFFSLCGVTLIQLFYYLYFFLRLAVFKNKPRSSSQTHPVSVIICARDEAANLAKNLPGALLQEYRTTHEVIVVNDNSFDETKYLLEELHKDFRRLQIVELKQEAKLIPGKKFPLSMGIKAAKHEIVLLTDADCMPASEHWIERMQETYEEGTEIVLGYGAYHRKKGLLNKMVRWETAHTAMQYLSYALAGIPYMGVGRNLSYRRGLFFKHKGFSSHNHIPSGDDDLFVNMAARPGNTSINIHPDAFTLSIPVRTWTQWFRQKTRHFSTGRYYKPMHRFLLGLYALAQFLFWPLAIISFVVFPWPWVAGVVGLRLVVQWATHIPVLLKLREKDLIAWLPLFDLWMSLYYVIFSFALFKKPRAQWK